MQVFIWKITQDEQSIVVQIETGGIKHILSAKEARDLREAITDTLEDIDRQMYEMELTFPTAMD